MVTCESKTLSMNIDTVASIISIYSYETSVLVICLLGSMNVFSKFNVSIIAQESLLPSTFEHPYPSLRYPSQT